MTWSALFDNAASLAIAGGAAAGAVGWSTRKAWLGLGRVRRFLDDYEGTPERNGVPARPGLMERMQTSETAQGQILDRLDTGDLRFASIESRLQAVVDELPKNGMPASVKLDYVYQWIMSRPDAPQAKP